jgi:hypothetical protein
MVITYLDRQALVEKYHRVLSFWKSYQQDIKQVCYVAGFGIAVDLIFIV